MKRKGARNPSQESTSVVLQMSDYPRLLVDSGVSGGKCYIPQINDSLKITAWLQEQFTINVLPQILVMKPRGVKKGTTVAQQ